MIKIIMLKGSPGCGKSSFCRELMAKEPGKWKRINNDSLRVAIDFNAYTPENEKMITQLREHLLRDFIKKNCNILIYNLNTDKRHFDDVVRIARSTNKDVEVIERPIYVDLDVAIERDAKRTGIDKVGEDTVRKWWKKLGGESFKNYTPKTETILAIKKEPIVQDTNLPKAIMCDLDGTAALIGNRSPYDASKCDIVDKLNEPVAEVVKAMHHRGHDIIFCSGREDKDKDPTIRFIEKHLPGIKYQLFMRKSGDMRADQIVKEEIYNTHINNKYNVLFILDDRKKVVSKWREMSLTCFAVAEGDF